MKIFGYTIIKTNELENKYIEILNEAKAIRKAKHPNAATFQHEVKEIQSFLLENGFTFLGNETAGNGFISAFGNGERLIWLSVNHNGSLASVFENVNAKGKDLHIKLMQSNENLENAKALLKNVIQNNQQDIEAELLLLPTITNNRNMKLRVIYDLINKL